MTVKDRIETQVRINPKRVRLVTKAGPNRPRRLGRNKIMLWTIALFILILWLAGLLTAHTFGGAIHILVIAAMVLVILRLLQRRGAST